MLVLMITAVNMDDLLSLTEVESIAESASPSLHPYAVDGEPSRAVATEEA